MFGSYRYVLAHMVLVSHLWTDLALWPGPYAVFSFFLLSGYLMATVLNATYGFSPRGTVRFFANRALRIYPPYLFVLGLGALLAWHAPEVTRRASPTFLLPDGFAAWLKNVAIFGLNRDPQRLVPPAWSLDIELTWYALLGLLLARRRWLVATWLLASLAWTARAFATELAEPGLDFPARYGTVAAASLPFAIGAAIHASRGQLARLLRSRWHIPVAALAFGANAVIPVGGPFLAGFYVSLLASAYLVCALAQLRPRDLPARWARWDRRLGDLSYPIFLGHMAVAAVALRLGWAEHKGPALLAIGAVGANALAAAVHLGVERPVAALRARVRGGAPGRLRTR